MGVVDIISAAFGRSFCFFSPNCAHPDRMRHRRTRRMHVTRS